MCLTEECLASSFESQLSTFCTWSAPEPKLLWQAVNPLVSLEFLYTMEMGKAYQY